MIYDQWSCRHSDLYVSYIREVGESRASAPGSPGQGRVLGVATRHRIRGAGVIRRSGGGGAGQVDRCPQHQVADVTHRVQNL